MVDSKGNYNYDLGVKRVKMLVCLIFFTSLDSVLQWVYGLLLGSFLWLSCRFYFLKFKICFFVSD